MNIIIVHRSPRHTRNSTAAAGHCRHLHTQWQKKTRKKRRKRNNTSSKYPFSSLIEEKKKTTNKQQQIIYNTKYSNSQKPAATAAPQCTGLGGHTYGSVGKSFASKRSTINISHIRPARQRPNDATNSKKKHNHHHTICWSTQTHTHTHTGANKKREIT